MTGYSDSKTNNCQCHKILSCQLFCSACLIETFKSSLDKNVLTGVIPQFFTLFILYEASSTASFMWAAFSIHRSQQSVEWNGWNGMDGTEWMEWNRKNGMDLFCAQIMCL